MANPSDCSNRVWVLLLAAACCSQRFCLACKQRPGHGAGVLTNP